MKRLLVRRPRQLGPCRLEQRLDDVGWCALTRLAAIANAMPLDSSAKGVYVHEGVALQPCFDDWTRRASEMDVRCWRLDARRAA
jgi:hypothetical protein